MARLLIQTQLSNVVNGKFDLACDSGWQMTINRAREMLKLNPDLHIDIMGPFWDLDGQCQLIADPTELHRDLFDTKRLRYLEHWIQPNALVTRYDFDWVGLIDVLDLADHKADPDMKYDAVYVNDPFHLRNFKALFHVVGGYQPKFFVHSHFVDTPEIPKFPKECSLWLGQCEASLKADFNFWQCESAMLQFFDSMGKWFTQDVVDDVRAKSMPWDDGYSVTEITQAPNLSNVRFDPSVFQQWRAENKKVIFFPNRISPSSGDYTNGMKFMFELLPKIREKRQDFVVVCGNPNLKFSNDELLTRCGENGYVKLHDFTLNRDEYKAVALQSDIVVGLYDKDAYGGTASRECIELGCVPLWLDVNEYSSIAREAGKYPHLVKQADMADIPSAVHYLLNYCDNSPGDLASKWETRLQNVIRQRCSYEATTPAAMRKMGLL